MNRQYTVDICNKLGIGAESSSPSILFCPNQYKYNVDKQTNNRRRSRVQIKIVHIVLFVQFLLVRAEGNWEPRLKSAPNPNNYIFEYILIFILLLYT